MKNILLKILILLLLLAVPVPILASGKMEVGVIIPTPPAIVFSGPPHMVIIPETNIYVVPDSDADIFFYGGWWWRPWQGRWYRSQHYHSGWSYHREIPVFYRNVPPGWRSDYRQNHWKGRQWQHQRISHDRVEKNWNKWEKERYWEKQNNWGVHDRKPEIKSNRPDSREGRQDSRDRKQNDRKPRDYQKDNREWQPIGDTVEPKQSQPRQRNNDRKKKPKTDR